jgi:tight adherence protein B
VTELLPFLIAALAAVAVVLFAVGVALSGGDGAVTARLERYASAGAMERTAQPTERESPVLAGLTRVIERQDMAARLSTELARADLKMKPAEWVGLWIASPFAFVAGAFILGFLFPALRNPVALFGIFLIGAYFPRVYLRRRQARRLRDFDAQLPDTITLLGNSLRSGSSFLQGIELVTRESQPPISDEFQRVVREMNLGVPLNGALNNLVRRVASEDLELMVTAIVIQSQVGGNLATILDAIAFTIRERMRIKGEINTLTAMQRYSGYVLMLLPVALGVILYLIAPAYMGLFFARPPDFFGLPFGTSFLLLAGFSMFVGYMIIRRIVAIKV